MDITDEHLMAHADGELADPDMIARIEGDADLMARVAVFRKTREMFAGMPADPVPDALAVRVRAMAAPNVVPMRRRVPVWQIPAAAAVALAVGLGAGLLVPQADGAAQMAAVLDTLPSGGTAVVDGQTVQAIATFRTDAGELCREYEQGDDARKMVTVSCRAEGAWNTRLAIATGGQGYAPVSGLDALDAWLTAAGAGDPLEPEDEGAALAER